MMVKLHVKRGEDSQFLYETSAITPIHDLTEILATIYNGRLKIERICIELEELCKHGVAMPPNASDEQVVSHDEWSSKCTPQGGYVSNEDPTCRRVGRAPVEKMAQVISKVVAEATSTISKECVSADLCLTKTKISELLEMLRDTVLIVFPMGLPPYDAIQQEFENNESLTDNQSESVLDICEVQLWWAGKPLQMDKLLSDYIGKNEKTKIIVKLQKTGQCPPSREPLMGEEEQKQLMLHAYRRQEEFKHIQDDDDNYLNAKWADKQTLKKSFHGVDNIVWKPH